MLFRFRLVMMHMGMHCKPQLRSPKLYIQILALYLNLASSSSVFRFSLGFDGLFDMSAEEFATQLFYYWEYLYKKKATNSVFCHVVHICYIWHFLEKLQNTDLWFMLVNGALKTIYALVWWTYNFYSYKI